MGKEIISAIIFFTKLPEGCIVILSTFVILLMAFLDIADILCDSKVIKADFMTLVLSGDSSHSPLFC